MGTIGGVMLQAALTVIAPFAIGWLASLLTDGIQWIVPQIKKLPIEAQQVLVGMVAGVIAGLGTMLGVNLCPEAMQACGLENIDVNMLAASLFALARKHAKQIKVLKAKG